MLPTYNYHALATCQTTNNVYILKVNGQPTEWLFSKRLLAILKSESAMGFKQNKEWKQAGRLFNVTIYRRSNGFFGGQPNGRFTVALKYPQRDGDNDNGGLFSVNSANQWEILRVQQ